MPRYLQAPTRSRFSSMSIWNNDKKYIHVATQPEHEPRSSAREVLTSLFHAAKHILHSLSSSKPSRKLTKRQSRAQLHQGAECNVNAGEKHARTSSTSTDGYRVASASQLNGRYIENILRGEQKTTTTSSPAHAHALHHQRNTLHPSCSVMSRSTSTPTRGATGDSREEIDRSNTPSTVFQYSPHTLSTIFEQAESESVIRPMSEVLSIGEARIGYMVRVSEYENSIVRFAAKAISLIEELGQGIDICGQQETALRREPGYDLFSPEYFHPYLTKLFTRCCLCDINIQGDPIKLASNAFKLGSAGLEIGACKYLNLPSHTGRPNHAPVLRTEYHSVTKQTEYIIHYSTPLCDKATLEKQYTLISQIDVTDPLRRLALQELNAESQSPSAPLHSLSISTQMRRFLSFVHWLGSYHNNAVCFVKRAKPMSDDTEPATDWQLRFASGQEMVCCTSDTKHDFDHMASAMEQDDPFVRTMMWGAGMKTTYLQYCVPVTDDRKGGEKWWVSWLVDKQLPAFWGERGGSGEEVVEYPVLV